MRAKREEKNRASLLWNKSFIIDVGPDILAAYMKDGTGACNAGHTDK